MRDGESSICTCGHFQGRHFAWSGSCAYNKNCSDVVLPYPDYNCLCQQFKGQIKEPTYSKCICGHSKNEHEVVHTVEGGSCSMYGSSIKPGTNSNHCGCHSFKLDNLSYIEELAKEKGLV